MKQVIFLSLLFLATGCKESEDGHVRNTYVISHTEQEAIPLSEQDIEELRSE